jgi:hypothetical protein
MSYLLHWILLFTLRGNFHFFPSFMNKFIDILLKIFSKLSNKLKIQIFELFQSYRKNNFQLQKMNPYQGYRNPAQNTYEDDNRHYDDNDQYEDQGYEGGHYRQQQGYGHEEEYEYYQPAKNQNVPGKSDRSFQKGTRNEEASFQGGSSNRGFYQPKDQKQMYEEDDVHHDDRNRGRPEDQKEPGKIAETIDTTKVKNSKLFQKFLQNENKEAPNKPPKDIKPALKANNYSANKDSKDAPKPKFTSNAPPQQQGFRPNEDPYYRRDQDFSNEDSHYRDKSHPTYDTSDAYGPPSKESKCIIKYKSPYYLKAFLLEETKEISFQIEKKINMNMDMIREALMLI